MKMFVLETGTITYSVLAENKDEALDYITKDCEEEDLKNLNNEIGIVNHGAPYMDGKNYLIFPVTIKHVNIHINKSFSSKEDFLNSKWAERMADLKEALSRKTEPIEFQEGQVLVHYES